MNHKTTLLSVLVLPLLIVYTFSATFQISSVSTCTQTTSGFCTKWEQTGTVVQDLGSCFPGNAKVLTRDYGLKLMSEIKIGDYILGQSNQYCLLKNFNSNQQCRQKTSKWVRVQAWLHHDAQHKGKYNKIYTNFNKGSYFHTTDYHLIAIENLSQSYQYIYAKDLNQKTLLGLQNKVQMIQQEEVLGLYSPLTQTSNYYILLNNNKYENVSDQMILAHSFGNIKNPENYQQIMNFLINGYQSIWGIPNQNEFNIHPVCNFLSKVFSFAVDGIQIQKTKEIK